MGKRIRGVKLKVEDVNKNTGKDISHTISKIKANEKKYTIILVLIFILLFLGLGYHFLRVKLSYPLEETSIKKSYLSMSSQIVLLSDNNVLSDDKGLKTDDIVIKVENNTCDDMNYKIIFKNVNNIEKECGCDSSTFDIGNIRYSLDGVNVKSITNEEKVLTTGYIKAYENNEIKIKMWLTSNNHDHYHGQFVIEKIED